ncbi:A24 family peptidase [Paraburkholderia ferrariae]|uniref:A24 family peptidase n=1 Tax=Paraburkholderia ferrariae TaxID=386056 RepID=UPI0004800D9B|nr:prepilin peptidase [Paraburkholderia ferrariae]
MHLAPLPPHPVPLCVTAWVLVAASTDLVARRIPNWLVGSGLFGALAVQVWLHGAPSGATAWLAGAATGFAAFMPFYLLRGMAAGDVKLMAMVGAWLGVNAACHVALATFVLGGAGSVLIVVCQGRLAQLLRNVRAMLPGVLHKLPLASAMPLSIAQIEAPGPSVGSLPYGVAIAAGTLGVLFAMAG